MGVLPETILGRLPLEHGLVRPKDGDAGLLGQSKQQPLVTHVKILHPVRPEKPLNEPLLLILRGLHHHSHGYKTCKTKT